GRRKEQRIGSSCASRTLANLPHTPPTPAEAERRCTILQANLFSLTRIRLAKSRQEQPRANYPENHGNRQPDPSLWMTTIARHPHHRGGEKPDRHRSEDVLGTHPVRQHQCYASAAKACTCVAVRFGMHTW